MKEGRLMGLDGMPDLNPWIDLHPERESARVDRQLTQSDRWSEATITGQVDATRVSAHLSGSTEPDVVVPSESGVSAVGAAVRAWRDSTGRVTHVSIPDSIPSGAVLFSVGVTGERLVQLDATTAALDAGLESARAQQAADKVELDGKLAENTDRLTVLDETKLPALTERVGSVEEAAASAQARADQAMANAQEMVVNGSFVDDYTGWLTHAQASLDSTDVPFPGVVASHVVGTGIIGEHINSGLVSLVPGHTYRFSVWAKGDAPGAVLYKRMSMYAGEWYDGIIPPGGNSSWPLTTEWEQYSFDYVHPSGSTWQKARYRAIGDGAYRLSAASVRDVTEAVAAQAAADALKSRVSTLETNLAAAQTQIGEAQGSIATLNDETLPGLQDDMRDAARLTEGTLDNARLNVGTLAAQIANVIQLNVSRLVADDASVNEAVINKLAVAIANVIELNADRITAGTIDTSRLDAQTVAAAVAQFLQLDVGQLTADTANIGDAVAQKIWAGVAKFAEITTEMLTAGHAVITGDMMVDTLIGKILSGAVLTAGGGSLPQILVGPASGTPGQGDSYGVYLSTPNSNATGSAYLAVTPAGPEFSMLTGDQSTLLSMDATSGLKVMEPSSGSLISTSDMLFGTKIFEHSGEITHTSASGGGWGDWYKDSMAVTYTATSSNVLLFAAVKAYSKALAGIMTATGVLTSGGTDFARVGTTNYIWAQIESGGPLQLIAMQRVTGLTIGQEYGVYVHVRARSGGSGQISLYSNTRAVYIIPA